MTTFVLATANPHKAAEMRAVLSELGITVVGRPSAVPDVDETETTLEGNALLKAHALTAATGMPAIADDTGLFVDALDGEPGVYSARYAGIGANDADNRSKLLGHMMGVPEIQRTARFRTVIAVTFPDGRELLVDGVMEGRIADYARGENGFGYDSLFLPHGERGRTMAEMTSDEKNATSHRARALRNLAVALAAKGNE